MKTGKVTEFMAKIDHWTPLTLIEKSLFWLKNDVDT